MPDDSIILSQFRQYLQRVVDQLGADLMRLSGTGIELPEARRVTLILQQHQPMKDREQGFASVRPEAPDTERVVQPTTRRKRKLPLAPEVPGHWS
jgi:hypothetical protein